MNIVGKSCSVSEISKCETNLYNIYGNVSHEISMDVARLLEEKNIIETSLEKLIHGSIEIREQNDKRLIYVHFREGKKQRSKYVGEFSNELYELIVKNNNVVRAYKKRLREIKKELEKDNYVIKGISDDVAINIDIARRNIVDSVYKQAMLEGIKATYSDIEALINNGKVKNMTAIDVQKVINLKRAWEFVTYVGVVQYPSNISLISQINAIVEEGMSYNAGRIRSVPVFISGTSYIPPLLTESQVKEDIKKITESDKLPVDKAIEALLYIKKNQLFLDGNKRTAIIFANHILIKHASGLLIIPAEKEDVYKKLLIRYYETDKKDEIVKFLKEECYRSLR